MFTFLGLGAPRIEGPDGPLAGPVAQRRRLALIALLASAPRAQVSRDKLCAYLWPEVETDAARAALADAVYALRKTLGRDAIVSLGDDLCLDPAFVQSDVAAFHAAMTQEQWGEAARLYAGPFLDGFFVGDAHAFDEWMEAERARLAACYAHALEALADMSAQAGDTAGETEWLRRLSAHDPYSSRIALRLIQSLAAAGDGAAALQHVRVHETLLREELGTVADPDIAALAEQIQAGRWPDRAARGTGHQPAHGTVRMNASAALVAPHARTYRESAADGAKAPERPAPRIRWRHHPAAHALRWSLLVVATLLVFVAGIRLRGHVEARSPRTAAVPSPNRLLVLPFDVHGSVEFTYLGEGIVSLLGVALDGAGELQAVDPRTALAAARRGGGARLDPVTVRRVAERLGAGIWVVGDVVESNRRIRLSASLFESTDSTRPRVQASVEGDVTQLFALVDELSTRLLAGTSTGPGQRATRTAALTTGSVAAFKAYLEGEQEMWRGQWDLALPAFQRATALDSTFALAWYRLSLAAEWFSRGDLQQEAAERAVRHMDRLSDRDRSLLEALLAWRRGAAADADRRYRAIVGLYPEDVEAWFQLGEVWFHYGPLLGQPTAASRQAWERVLSLEPDHAPALFHLARLAALEQRDAELDSLTRRIERLQPGSERTLEMRAFRALRRGTPAEQRAVRAALGQASDNTLIITVRSLLTYLGAPASTDAFVELLTQPHRSIEVQALGHLLLAHTAAARGQWAGAQSRLDMVGSLIPAWSLEHRALLSLAPHLAVPAAELARLRDELLQWDATAVPPTRTPGLYVRAHGGNHPHVRLYLLGMLSARLSDHAAAETYVARLQQAAAMGLEFPRSLAHAVRAEIYSLRGMHELALHELDAARSEQLYDYTNNSPFHSQAYERFRRADLLRQLGRPREALGWYGSLREVSPYEFVHLGPALLAQAEIHEELGDHEEAASYYARLIELWREPSPPLRPMVRRAARRLQDLSSDAGAPDAAP